MGGGCQAEEAQQARHLRVGALAVALKQVNEPAFKTYIVQVKKNAAACGVSLMSKGYKLVTDGTENHLLLWDLRPQGLTGNKVEKLCDLAHITLNKNAVFGDASALSPGGVRIGAPAMTSRGLVESDFVQVAEFLHEVVQIGLKIQAEKGKMLKQFMEGIEQNQDILNLRTRVEAFAKKFEMPGFDVSKLS